MLQSGGGAAPDGRLLPSQLARCGRRTLFPTTLFPVEEYCTTSRSPMTTLESTSFCTTFIVPCTSLFDARFWITS